MKLFLTLFFFVIKISVDDSTFLLDKNFELTKLSENAYLIKSSSSGNGVLDCNHLLIVDSAEMVLVNTPVNDSLTAVLINCIEKKFMKKVTKVIVSHFHDDSAGGLKETAKRGILSYGLDKTKELLKSEGKNIDIVFTDSMEIVLKTTRIKLMYFGAGHSRDNIVAWLPSEKILFGGCMLKAPSVNYIGNTKDADMKSWSNTVKKVKARCSDARIIIPGHMEFSDQSIFDHTIQIVQMNN